MTFVRTSLAALFVLTLGLGLTACSAETKPADDGHGHTDGDGHDHGDAIKDAADKAGDAVKDAADKAGDAVKDAADQAADAVAKVQTICPVSGDPLGDMGDPVEVEHEGRKIKLCCAGCVEDFQKDAAKYIAKVDAALK